MIALVLLPFEVDPNVVKPGWTPLIITIVLALAMVGLFISMRRQFRKIDARRASGNFGPTDDDATLEDATPEDVTPEGVTPEPRRAAEPKA